MLWPAIEDPDPVVVFEHGSLYNLEGDLADDAGSTDICRAVVRRPGADVTLVAYGGTLGTALAAADTLAAEGVDAAVVDLRVLRPLDMGPVLESVTRTHRAVVVDEGWRTGSLAAEVAARIGEEAFWDLDAPVARVCSVEVPMPYARHLEQAALPNEGRVVEAVRRLR
jgi:pyruvate dehydrogenase E1 component beta subunit